MTDWEAEAMNIYHELKSEGFEMIVRIPGFSGVWDPVSMSFIGGLPDTDYKVAAVKKSYSVIDGSIIGPNDVMLVFSSYGVDPSGDLVKIPRIRKLNKLLIRGIEQLIINVSPVDPGNVTIMYEAQSREVY